MKFILMLLVVSLCSLDVLAENNALATLRNTYQDQVNKISDEEMAAIANTQVQYISALDALERQFQQKGLLDALLKVKGEKDRFSVSRVVEERDISREVSELSALQHQYIANTKTLPMDPAQKRITLAGFYERSLKNLEADLTRNNDIAGAIEVKKERDGIEAREEISRARAVVAEAARQVQSKVAVQVPQVKVPEVNVPEVQVPQVVQVPKMDKAQVLNHVRARAKLLLDDIVARKWEGAVKYYDPEYLKVNGERRVISLLKARFSMLGHIDNDPAAKVRIGDVDMNENGDRVNVTPEIWANNKSHPLQKMGWVQNPGDGQWYVVVPKDIDRDREERRPMKPPHR